MAPVFQGFNLNAAALAAPVLNTRTNLPGKSEFHTLEYSATRRQSGSWSLSASGGIRLNRDNDTGYFGNNLRALQAPSTMNDFINTDDGRFIFSTWSFKLNGSYRAKWNIVVTPALRVQSGQPFGRTFLAGTAHGVNYSQRILAEPIDSRRQDNIVVLDARVEKVFKLAKGTSFSGFFDLYNITQLRRGLQHGLGRRIVVPAAVNDHRTSDRAVRTEVRLVGIEVVSPGRRPRQRGASRPRSLLCR